MRRHYRFGRLAVAAAAILTIQNCATAPGAPPKLTGGPGPSLVAFEQGIDDDEKQRELAIYSLDVAVEVRGGIAETTLTAVFDNPEDALLEGRFALNMPRGSVINGYALDIEGELIDGVLETKYTAAEAYQRRVARRVDPGVAEVDYGDRFETRIYPIPAEGKRTIRISLASPIDPAKGYVLPLALKAPVERFTLSVKGDAKVTALPTGAGGGSTIEANDVQLTGALKLAPEKRMNMLVVSQHPGAEKFFELTTPAPRERVSRAPLHMFWDRSVSRTDDELATEAELAEAFAIERGLTRVTLTLFDSGKAETMTVGVDRLAERLGEIHYRGGTSFAGLQQVAVAPDADCLMFSDGRVTIDDRKGFRLPCAVTTITSGPESDRAWLMDVAERTGGAFATLGKDNSKDVLARLMRPEASIVAVTDGAGAPLETAHLAAGAGALRIVGPLPRDGVVLVRMAGEAAPRRFAGSGAAAAEFAGPGALWARQRIGAVAADLTPDTLADMARHYNIATPQTSFVVMETPADYIEARIQPPATYPKELRAEYASLIEEKDEDDRYERENRFETVLAMWESQKEWWNTRFSGARSAKDRKQAAATGGASADLARPDFLPAPAPTAAPPPALAEAAAPGNDADRLERVMVTGSLIDTAEEEPDSATIEAGRAGKTEVAEWKLERPYIKRLTEAGSNWEGALDREMKAEGSIPLFWFDVAEWHWRGGRREEARRAVEAALDLPTRDNQTLQIAASRLLRYGSHDRAIWLLERLMERETDRPQPLRTLALALIERAKGSESVPAAKADLERAVGLLAKAATGVFDVEAHGIEVTALMEANAALARLKAMGGSSNVLDERLVALLDTDVRVVMEWNTPRTDIDLWVVEPDKFEVGYSSDMSPWGGKLTADVTNGYGPEEYATRRAQHGVYVVRSDTFASDRTNPNGPSTVTVRLIRNFGRPNQTEELFDREMLTEDEDMLELGKFTIE